MYFQLLASNTGLVGGIYLTKVPSVMLTLESLCQKMGSIHGETLYLVTKNNLTCSVITGTLVNQMAMTMRTVLWSG